MADSDEIVTLTFNDATLTENPNDGSDIAHVSGSVQVDYTAQTVVGSVTITDANGTYVLNGPTQFNGGQIDTAFTIFGSAGNSGTNRFDFEYFGTHTPTAGSASFTQPDGVLYTSTSAPVSSTACYCTGTAIRTTVGDIAVENLTIGNLVVTASGESKPIKWIGNRSYSARFARNNSDLLPICFKAGSLANGVPARDLWVSPKHAMFLDGVLVPAECLVNGVNVLKAEKATDITYWHVELESHDVLIAEGAPSESFVDDDSRCMFHNAHTFREMYPGALAAPAIYCAPRVESGYVLDAIRRRLADRAGIAVQGQAFGQLHGTIDLCDGVVVQGWAQDAAYPNGPVCLDIMVDGVHVAMVYADRFRGDLLAAGVGDGHHAFDVRLPAPLSGDTTHTIEVRRSADGVAIAGTVRLAQRAA